MDGKFTKVANVRDFGQITIKRSIPPVRVLIEALLMDSKCFNEVKPYLMNGSLTGHRVMDALRMVDILKKHDNRLNGEGGGLTQLGHEDYFLAKQMMVVLRSRYSINAKYWKIESENEKRVLLIAPANDKAKG